MYPAHRKVKQNKPHTYENAYLAEYLHLKYVYHVLRFYRKDILHINPYAKIAR